uniref:NADH-ubiquinone oxidoreductase chain 4 n=1 Tax=Parborlasia corrugatus TaxID=187802 RepID=A0A3S5HLL1_PARCG|nr:NADH dehydrogenase subunit 4 [Parborlasia corrugatus]
MLIFLGSFSLLLGYSFMNKYFWYVTIVSFFWLTFLSIFLLMGFGWWGSDLILSWDLVSSSLVCLSVWLGALMFLANWRVHLVKNFSKSFGGVVLLLISVLILSFFVENFFLFYVFFEFSLVPTFLLILGWGYQPERMSASMYMIIYTVGASLPLLGCLFFCWANQAHLSFFLDFFQGKARDFYSNFFFFFFILAFLVKIPVFFVHLWLPKAHVEAPVAGSMILAGVLLKLGGYGLIRVVSKLSGHLGGSAASYLSLVLWGGAVTGIICLRQVDLKGLIAYSSVGHMGIFVAGIFSNNVWGLSGGLLMLLAHGLCSSAMFALANVGYESVGSRSMVLSKGFLSLFPLLALFWFLICSSNMAAPPSLNLGSEILLFIGVLGKSWVWGVFLAFLSFLGGAYSLYLYVSTQHGGMSSFYFSYLPAKSRSFFMLICHWIPLNFFFLSLSILTDWVC